MGCELGGSGGIDFLLYLLDLLKAIFLGSIMKRGKAIIVSHFEIGQWMVDEQIHQGSGLLPDGQVDGKIAIVVLR